MATEFKILCADRRACPDVKDVLAGMDFKDIKDLNKSPSYDISAKHDISGREEVDKIARMIFEKTKNRVTSIHVES